jgi:hypothetical protein
MNNNIHQLCKQQQPGLGMPAYWSAVASSSLNTRNFDRTPEISLGSEGAGYA